MARRQIGLIFHGIGTPRRALEPGEAPYWISRDQFAAVLDQVMTMPDPQAVRITFDDGNLSDLDLGLPLLLERGLTAEFFVLTGRIGKPGSLGAADIRALQAAGMGIGSHGMDHQDWSRLDPASLGRELEASRAILEDICVRPVKSAAIPFGRYNAAVLRALTRAGYDRVFSSDGGWMNPAASLLPRTSIRCTTTAAAADDILHGRMGLGRRLRRAAAMLAKRLI